MENTINALRLLEIAIPSIVTVVGFIVTYNLNKASIKEEIYKSKNISSSEKLQVIFGKLLEIIRYDSKKMGEGRTLNELNVVFDNIVIYGSSKLISIVTAYKEFAFSSASNMNNNYPLAYIGLIISQFKYDISGEYIPADTWYRYTIKDYSVIKKDISDKIDEIIGNLKLDPKLRCNG